MIEVFHNEIAALPVSFDGLRISRECVFIFSFQVNKLPAASATVDPNPFVSPCEYLILVRVINDIPCCRCSPIKCLEQPYVQYFLSVSIGGDKTFVVVVHLT